MSIYIFMRFSFYILLPVSPSATITCHSSCHLSLLLSTFSPLFFFLFSFFGPSSHVTCHSLHPLFSSRCRDFPPVENHTPRFRLVHARTPLGVCHGDRLNGWWTGFWGPRHLFKISHPLGCSATIMSPTGTHTYTGHNRGKVLKNSTDVPYLFPFKYNSTNLHTF